MEQGSGWGLLQGQGGESGLGHGLTAFWGWKKYPQRSSRSHMRKPSLHGEQLLGQDPEQVGVAAKARDLARVSPSPKTVQGLCPGRAWVVLWSPQANQTQSPPSGVHCPEGETDMAIITT